MAKKSVAKYVLSRAKLAKKLDELNDKLTVLELEDTTPNDLNSFLSDLSNELNDLALNVLEQS